MGINSFLIDRVINVFYLEKNTIEKAAKAGYAQTLLAIYKASNHARTNQWIKWLEPIAKQQEEVQLQNPDQADQNNEE
ncbi:MAG: hypothetical protein WA432_00360 [Candidatus Babeliaceae bacterium]